MIYGIDTQPRILFATVACVIVAFQATIELEKRCQLRRRMRIGVSKYKIGRSKHRQIETLFAIHEDIQVLCDGSYNCWGDSTRRARMRRVAIDIICFTFFNGVGKTLLDKQIGNDLSSVGRGVYPKL